MRAKPQSAQAYLAFIQHGYVAVIPLRGQAIFNFIDYKPVQVRVRPSHGDLKNSVQVEEREAVRDENTTPDRGLYVQQAHF
jgi:hypothetical protein